MKRRSNIVKFAVVGCGRISKRHIASIKRNPRAELYALCDIDRKKLNESQKINKSKIAYNKLDNLLNDKNVDVINLCTPSGMHPEMIEQCVLKGKHVLCEKPLGLDYAKSLNAVKLAKRHKKKIFVCFQNRYNPPIEYLKRILDKKLLGKIYAITAIVRWYRDNSYYNDWHGKEKMGGGILQNQAIHYVDMLLYLMNKKPTYICCLRKTLGHNIEIDDMALVNIIFSDNTIGSIEATTLSYPVNMEGSITLQCEKGTVKIGGQALNEIEYWEGNGKPRIRIGNKIENVYGESHYEVIDKIINVLGKKEKSFSTGEEALLVTKVIEMAHKSAKKGKPLKIK